MRIGMFGTFDIGNFGDILFPIVAEKKLSQLADVNLQRFSYRKMQADSWCYDVSPIDSLPDALDTLDLILIGGGHLLHFTREMAEGYYPPAKHIPHPLGFWWLPAVCGAMAGLPVATHGVSTSDRFPDWGEPLLRTFASSVDYFTVRDTLSAERMACYGAADVSVIPDSIFSISDVLHRGNPSAAFLEFKKQHGLGEKYLIVQPSDQLWKRRDQVIGLIADARGRGWDVLELPIGFEIGNKPGFYGGAHGLIEVKSWPEPFLLAEIIANAEAAVGVSLHLSIVASAYGIPVIRPSYARSSKFILLDKLPNIAFLQDRPALHGRSDREPDMAVASELKMQLDAHWAKIIVLAGDNRPRQIRKAVGAWDQLCATPAAFRAAQSGLERAQETIEFLKRRRGYAMHHVRKNIYKHL